jgi:hypothetical protein
MTVYYALSTDTNAPQLSGQAGALVALLDALLVNGYNSVSVSSITRSGSTVTVTTTAAHGFGIKQVARIQGAAQTEYNGKWKVATVIDSTHFTFDIGAATPASPATGTITCDHAPVGWTKDYTASNKGSYRQPLGSLGRCYLDVDDTNTTYSLVRGYRNMTAIATGTDPFPSIAQVAAATNRWTKSNTASTATRRWSFFSDDYLFYLAAEWQPGSSYDDCWDLYAFGDGVPYNSADSYLTFLASQNSVPSYPGHVNYLGGYRRQATLTNLIYGAMNYAGSTPSIRLAWDSWLTNVYGSQSNSASVVAPSPITGDNVIAPLYLLDYDVSGTPLRGLLPGFYPGVFKDTGLGLYLKSDFIGYSGKTFMAQTLAQGAGNNQRGINFFDLDGPWR